MTFKIMDNRNNIKMKQIELVVAMMTRIVRRIFDAFLIILPLFSILAKERQLYMVSRMTIVVSQANIGRVLIEVIFELYLRNFFAICE